MMETCFNCAWYGPRFVACEEHANYCLEATTTAPYSPSNYKGYSLSEKALSYNSNPFKDSTPDSLEFDIIKFAIETHASYVYQRKLDPSYYWINWSDTSYIEINKNKCKGFCTGATDYSLSKDGNRNLWRAAK